MQVGFYTEVVFHRKGVRFIVVNNYMDSDNSMGNDLTPFRNIMNKCYAKETSNRIRSIFLSGMNDGKRCSGSFPCGYNRLPGEKQTLVVDPAVSQVVRRIFELAAQSKGTTGSLTGISGWRCWMPRSSIPRLPLFSCLHTKRQEGISNYGQDSMGSSVHRFHLIPPNDRIS